VEDGQEQRPLDVRSCDEGRQHADATTGGQQVRPSNGPLLLARRAGEMHCMPSAVRGIQRALAAAGVRPTATWVTSLSHAAGSAVATTATPQIPSTHVGIGILQGQLTTGTY
jgi:hypothetical protein